MPIDVELAEWMDQITPMFPAIDLGLRPLEVAAAMRGRQRPKPPEPTPGLSVEDVLIPGSPAIAVRLYRPAGVLPLPLIVSFHGGGWVVGNVETDDASCRQLAVLSGCAVASVEYRLAPEHVFPAALDDSYNATVWLAANAATLGFEPATLRLRWRYGRGMRGAWRWHFRCCSTPSATLRWIRRPIPRTARYSHYPPRKWRGFGNNMFP